ncbi:20 kDa chaperonin, chloroplastic [Asimina triloba]
MEGITGPTRDTCKTRARLQHSRIIFLIDRAIKRSPAGNNPQGFSRVLSPFSALPKLIFAISSQVRRLPPLHVLFDFSRFVLRFDSREGLVCHFSDRIPLWKFFTATAATRSLPSFDGLRPSMVRVLSAGPSSLGFNQRHFQGLVVRAATTVAPKAISLSLSLSYTSIKPLGDRVLVKIKASEERTSGGILLPSTAQSKPQGGEVVAVGEGRTIGDNKLEISVKTGTKIVYSKYAGTELEFNGDKHLIVKEDDIVGILETDDVKDLEPLNDRLLIKVAEVEEKTAGGLLLTEAAKEKPSIGTVVAVGPGPLDEEGKRNQPAITPGSTVMYSKYAGNDFKSADGSEFIVLRAPDVMAVLS